MAVLRLKDEKGNWVPVTTIKGDKGDTGPRGEAGPKGDPGEQGERGLQGEKGLRGEIGPKGLDGVSITHSWSGPNLILTSASGTTTTYLKGDPGIQGPAGANGKSVAHSWSGTNLTLTSASGTTTTNLQGPAGKDGLTTKISLGGTLYTQSGGTIILPAASETKNGYMSKEDKNKLDGLALTVDSAGRLCVTWNQ